MAEKVPARLPPAEQRALPSEVRGLPQPTPMHSKVPWKDPVPLRPATTLGVGGAGGAGGLVIPKLKALSSLRPMGRRAASVEPGGIR